MSDKEREALQQFILITPPKFGTSGMLLTDIDKWQRAYDAARAALDAPVAAQTTHKPGCDALGGYGNGVGPCSCGAVESSAQELSEALPEPTFRLTWHDKDARYTVSKPNIDSTDCYTPADMRAYVDARAQAARMEALADAERAVDDVDEPAWYGYECPNTFKDGTSAAAAAIRALGGKGAA